MLISRAAEVAFLALPHLDPSGPAVSGVRLQTLRMKTGLPGPFLAKVLQRLAFTGLLKSKKGRSGGFVLGRPATSILLADVVLALEGADELDQVYPMLEGPAGRVLELPRRQLITLLRANTLATLSAPILPVEEGEK